MKNLTADELRDKYLKFFESKGHTIIPGASVIPEVSHGRDGASRRNSPH